MRVVIQRVRHASVAIDGTTKSAIGQGLLVLVGIEEADGADDSAWLVKKIVNLRVFDDADGVMNLSVSDIGGEVLVVSQFTLMASTKKGNRPSYIRAARPEHAVPLYEASTTFIAGEALITSAIMTLKEAQSTVDQWIKTYGVRYFSELTNMACLTEEVGELARVMARRYGDQSFKPGESTDPADEMADVLWVLLCLANQTGVDLTEAFRKNLEKKTRRDATRHLNNPKLNS